MKTFKYCFLLVSFSSINTGFVNAENSASIATSGSIEAYCSVNSEPMRLCFLLDVSQCKDVFSTIVATCSQDVNGYPVPTDDTTAQDLFKICIENEFKSSLISRGIDLVTPCGQ